MKEVSLHRNNTNSRITNKIIPFNYKRSSSSTTSSSLTRSTSISNNDNHHYYYSYQDDHHIDYHFSLSPTHENSLVPKKYGGIIPTRHLTSTTGNTKSPTFFSIIRSFFCQISLTNLFATTVSACQWIASPTKLITHPSSSTNLGRKVIGTLFGLKKSHVSFAVQPDPRSEPVLLLELAISTSMLVREMSSGLVRIALECEKRSSRGGGGERRLMVLPPPATGNKLYQEPMWTMYCNGKKCGYAVSRVCRESDLHVLRTIHTVSAGAGVIPVEKVRDGNGSESELMYMRAKFDRVVGNRDSEAFYMVNPDGDGGPELSIFLLRI